MPHAQGHIVVKRRPRNGNDGNPGLDGCILRVSEWAKNVHYTNDEAKRGGTRYLDIAVVTTGANSFQCYKCILEHDSSDSIKCTNTKYWQKFNKLQPIYTPLIMAQHALLKFTQTNQLLVMKGDNSTVALGLGGGNFPLWIGAITSNNAPFRVSIEGKLTSTDADIKGKITATSGAIGGFSINGSRLYWKENDYLGEGSRTIKIGVSSDKMEGLVDIAFNQATDGKFGIKVRGNIIGGAAIYASSNETGFSYPKSNQIFAGYFDGPVEVNDKKKGLVTDMCTASKFRILKRGNGVTTQDTYQEGVNWSKEAKNSPNLDSIRLIVQSGLIVGYYNE